MTTTSGGDGSPMPDEEEDDDEAANGSKAGLLVNDRYRLIRKVGNGSFGVIYFAVHVADGAGGRDDPVEPVAVKLEPNRTNRARLPFEGELYRTLRDGVGIPNVLWSGRTGPYNALVMQYLGPSLEDLFNFCSRRFSLQTTLMLAEQMIDRVEFVHGKSIVHRDIKPNNFLMGTGSDSNKVYVIDFGLAKFYRNPNTGRHIPYRTDKGLTGTARYASVRNHKGREQSRRDDLETLGYVLIYFVRGRLPWQGLKIGDKRAKYDKIRQLKESTPIDKLCKGCPKEFCDYIRYCRNLKFEQTPDYLYLKTVFRQLYRDMNYQTDGLFDWKTSSAQSNHRNDHGRPIAVREPGRNTGIR